MERNHDGKIDYVGFTEQFHEPAKEIGFNLAVLLTNLSEHMPNEPRSALKKIEFALSVGEGDWKFHQIQNIDTDWTYPNFNNHSIFTPKHLRLARFLETAGSVLKYFEPFLGRIEIMGSSKRIERVYFEIKESNIEQWEKPQIKVPTSKF